MNCRRKKRFARRRERSFRFENLDLGRSHYFERLEARRMLSTVQRETNADGTVYTLSDAASGGWLEMNVAGSGVTQVIDTNVARFGLDGSGAAVALEDTGDLALFPANSPSREQMLSSVSNFVVDANNIVTALQVAPGSQWGNLYRFAPGSANAQEFRGEEFNHLVAALGYAVALGADGTLRYFPDNSANAVELVNGGSVSNFVVDANGSVVALVKSSSGAPAGALWRWSADGEPPTQLSGTIGSATYSAFQYLVLDGDGDAVALDDSNTQDGLNHLWLFKPGASSGQEMVDNTDGSTGFRSLFLEANGTMVGVEPAPMGTLGGTLVLFATGSTNGQTMHLPPSADGFTEIAFKQFDIDGSGAVVALDPFGNLVRFAPGDTTSQTVTTAIAGFVIDGAGFVVARSVTGALIDFPPPGDPNPSTIVDNNISSIAVDGTGAVIALTTTGDLLSFAPGSTVSRPVDSNVFSFAIDNIGQVVSLEGGIQIAYFNRDASTGAYDRQVLLPATAGWDIMSFHIDNDGYVIAVMKYVAGNSIAPYEIAYFVPAPGEPIKYITFDFTPANLATHSAGNPVVTAHVSQVYTLANGSILVTIWDTYDSVFPNIVVPPQGLSEMFLVAPGAYQNIVPYKPASYSSTFYWITGVSLSDVTVLGRQQAGWVQSEPTLANEYAAGWSYSEPQQPPPPPPPPSPWQIILGAVGFGLGAIADIFTGGALTPVLADAAGDLIGSDVVGNIAGDLLGDAVADAADQGVNIAITEGSFDWLEAGTAVITKALGIDEVGDSVGEALGLGPIVSKLAGAALEKGAGLLVDNLITGGAEDSSAGQNANAAANGFVASVESALQTSAISSTFVQNATSFLNSAPGAPADLPFLSSALSLLNGAVGGNWNDPTFASFASAGASLLEQIVADGFAGTAFATYAASQLVQIISGGFTGSPFAQRELTSLEDSVANTPAGSVPLAPLIASGGPPLTATVGQSFTGSMATFTDPNGAGATGDYTASINWGDGTAPDKGAIMLNSGVFTVTATHTYSEQGPESAVVTITRGAATPVTVTASIGVTDAAIVAVPTTLTATAGDSQTFNVATFTDPGGAQSVGDYHAAIDWGGGTAADNGAITLNSGVFTVSGDHTYSTGGTMSVSVTIEHGNAAPVVTTTSIVVTAPFATHDVVYTVGSGTISVSAANGLLENDTGPSQLSVTAGTFTGSQGGTFAFHGDGSFIYTPPVSFPGYDTVQFTVSDASGDKATQTVNVLSQPGGVVWKFYESVLGRNPDYGGLNFWINDFENGGKTGDIAVGFFESDELLNKIIGGYYQQYLGRTLDENGLAFWKQQWRATGGPELIKAGFAASPEFNNNAGNTPDGWLTALYQRILNRTPDPQGFAFWQQQLTGGMSEFNVALGFFESVEAYKNDVTSWFNEYLGRAPSNAELQQYAAQMTQGKTDRDVEQEITNLPEYGQNPPAPAADAAERLPDYFQQSASTSDRRTMLAAKDSLFAALG